jgi:tRNA-splicing ligase RtcB
LELASDGGQVYLADMQWAIRYASENRLLMLNRTADLVDEDLKAGVIESSYIDSPHNFARIEGHFGRQLIVHRKSTNSARLGEVGIIPGSMSGGSRIVVGRGHPESLNSSSHGAGRTMSRSESFGNLQVKHFKARMGSIVFRKEHADRLLDESPAAYRRLSDVMQAQCDLVATRDTLKTVLNYKSL